MLLYLETVPLQTFGRPEAEDMEARIESFKIAEESISGLCN